MFPSTTTRANKDVMKPLFSYYGGKQKLAHKLVPMIPKHTVYVEPFAGGAALLFAKPWPEVTNTSQYREVVNDLDSRIVNFYRVCRDQEKAKRLVHMLELTPYSREEYALAKSGEFKDDVEAAWAWFVNINSSFAKKPGDGWGTSVYGQSQAETFTSKVGKLPEILERFSGVHVEHRDALEVIKQWDSPHTFFYCDPPYPGSDQRGYNHRYTLEGFRALCAALENCQGSWMLSAYECGVEPAGAERVEFQTKNFSTNGKHRKPEARTEVVWKRAAAGQVRPEIQKLYDSGKFDCFNGDSRQNLPGPCLDLFCGDELHTDF